MNRLKQIEIDKESEKLKLQQAKIDAQNGSRAMRRNYQKLEQEYKKKEERRKKYY